MGPLPEYLDQFFAIVGNNTNYEKPGWQKAPQHMIDPDVQQIDKERLAGLTAAAGDSRTRERAARIAEVRDENRDL